MDHLSLVDVGHGGNAHTVEMRQVVRIEHVIDALFQCVNGMSVSHLMQEENDMPHVLPDAHELVGSYEGLEMSSQAEDARVERLDLTIQTVNDTIGNLLKIMNTNETFRTSILSNADDRRTMIRAQGTVLQHLGMLLDDVKTMTHAVHASKGSNKQLLRNMAAHDVLALNAYMSLEVPEQDLRPGVELPAIDLLNSVLPRDSRLYENRNMERPPDASVPFFRNNNPLDVLYDANGGIQLSQV